MMQRQSDQLIMQPDTGQVANAGPAGQAVDGHNIRSVIAAYEQYRPADNLIVWGINEMLQLIISRTRLRLKRFRMHTRMQ